MYDIRIYIYICIYLYTQTYTVILPFVSLSFPAQGVITESHRRSYADHLVQANRERCGVVLVLGAIR